MPELEVSGDAGEGSKMEEVEVWVQLLSNHRSRQLWQAAQLKATQGVGGWRSVWGEVWGRLVQGRAADVQATGAHSRSQGVGCDLGLREQVAVIDLGLREQ
eukprot:54849-Rhodomonas_salina.1